MKLEIGKNQIYSFLIFTIFLDAYSLFQIGNRHITFIYLGIFVLALFSIKDMKNITRGLADNLFVLLMIMYMPINYLIKGNGEVSSLLIGMFCWFFYAISYRNTSEKIFEETVRLFQKGMCILAVYGIYQVLAYQLNLPFKDPWIDGFMVTGYNWGNYVNVGSLHIRRANAIFREPSYYSQFLALNVLIYFSNYITNEYTTQKSKRNVIKWLAINVIAMIVSFSGTGLVMMIIGMGGLLLTNKKVETLKFVKKNIGLILLVIIGVILICLIPNSITKYILGRTAEFDSSNIESISGYIRMVLPYQAALEIIKSGNYILGCGIGNASTYISTMGAISFLMSKEIGNTLIAAMQPIIPRTIAEEGCIGFIILLGFFWKAWKKKNLVNSTYKALLLGTYIMSFMHGTWSSEVYWLMLGFLNVRFIEKNDE